MSDEPMDCEHCQHLLLDLAYGECSPSEEKTALAHVATCASCGADLARIRAGISLSVSLPMREPSSQTVASILSQARAHALSTRTLSQSPASKTVATISLADRIREFLGQFAMGRQVAMATSMILVVAVGLWFVPQARRHDRAVGHVVNPDPDGEAGPSNGIVPAAPLDLDLRAGRIRARGDEPERRRERPAPPAESVASTDDQPALAEMERKSESPEPLTAQSRVARQVGKELATDPSAQMALIDDSLSGSNVREESQRMPEPSSPSAEPSTRSRSDDTLGAGYGMTAAPPARKGRSAPASLDLEFAEESAEAPSPQTPQAASAPYPGAPPAPRPAAELSRGAADVASGSDDETNALTPEAQLALARSLQRSGRCDAAVVQYEGFLKRAPRHRDAMLEAARCYQQLGRIADAERWTKRAASVASTNSPKSAPAQPATSVQGQ